MLTRAPRARRSAVERGQQLADAVWLGQEMRTLGQVFELRTLVTRGHHDARPWLLLQRFGRDGQARHALGHADVGDHVRKGVSALELLQGLAPVPGHGDLVTVIGERALDDEAQVVLVLHEQHVQRAHPASGTGRRITTVAPLPGELTSSTPPPDWDAKPNTWLRPRPLPLPTSLVVKNGSKTRVWFSAGMPGPVSLTSIHTSRASPPSGDSG